MGIHKLMSFKELMKEKNTRVKNLAKVCGVPRTTISNIANEATPFERVTVSNALAISKAMSMTVEEVYDKLYFERITHD
ncbi:helix-turn-helix domain-containing protein [bacterium c-19]|nr:helix-turn-helix domain-containing protein [bacterium c-19]